MNTNEEKTVTIPQSEYDDLLKDQELLQALQRAGVDNWEGYEMALEILREDEDL
jgi:hypothetical protein